VKLSIINKQKKITVKKELRDMIRSVVKTAAEVENIKFPFEICIVLTGNVGIQKLNREFRNMDKPTDVLSFPMFEKSELKKILKKNSCEEIIVLGDIIVSLERALEQAEEYGHSFEREAGYLVAHGFLHLLGYDHIKKEEKCLMREKEENIMGILSLARD
jgi:probable rRNA maturation factor